MNNIHISIPEPCHENWNKMTETQKGKFCGVCTKEVVDFTHYSDEQLIKYLNSNNNLCGRFTQQQLDRDLVLERRKNRFISKSLFAGLFSLFVLNSHTTKAQEKPKTEQTDKKYVSIPLKNTTSQKEITVSGIVNDGHLNEPLPFVNVYIKTTTTGMQTDMDGKFQLNCKKGDILIISYVGYETIEYKVDSNKNISDLSFTLLSTLTGEIVITGYSKKRWFGGNLFTRFTNLFRKEKRNPKYRYIQE